MKKILVGLLTLASLSAFADCYYEMAGSHKTSRENQVERIMKKKGFSNNRPDKVAYRLNFDTLCTNEMQGDPSCMADASLERISDKVIVASGSRDGLRVLDNVQLQVMLGKIIKSFPSCAELIAKP